MSEPIRANHPWKTAVLAGMASYLDSGALVASGIAIGALYAPALGLGPGAIGALLGLQTFMFALGALFGGRLGDRFGRRTVFTFSLILYAAGAALLTWAGSTAVLYVGVIAIGLAIGADLPVSLSMINEEAPEGSKGKLVAFTNILWTLGIVVPVALSSVVGGMGVTGGRILFGQLVVVSLVVLVLRWTMRESVEWSAARQVTDADRAGGAETVHFSQIGQLFRPPVVAAVVATAVFYAAWNLGANTYGQFGTFLWTNLTGSDVQTYSTYTLLGFPLGFLAAYLFMRVADRPARRTWFVVGVVLNVAAWIMLTVVGATEFTLLVGYFMTAIGGSFAGETIYKVWSQELVPTLLRSTMQGMTIAFARVISALFAFVTPTIALANDRLLFGLLLVLSLVGSAIGLFWIPRLPRARDIEEPPVIVGGAPQTLR
jgi:MFS transporter, SP family, inositol transporter